MTKKTLKLIWDLNNLYSTFWSEWTKTKSCSYEFYNLSNKLKLIKKVTKNIEEKERWFLKSSVNYTAWWKFILSNSDLEFDDLSKKVSELMLWVSLS